LIVPQAMAVEPSVLDSFGEGANVAVIGASGAIGGAFAGHLKGCPTVERVFELSRASLGSSDEVSKSLNLDLENENSIADAANAIGKSAGALHLVIVATGLLHDGDRLQPEKTWLSLSGDAMEQAFRVNTIGPALVAKHFLPCLATDRKSAFAVLSARVGSIEDNRLGGWHAYRASKAGLNMMIKTLSLELARRNPSALCVALHPGTVDGGLSKPFQRGVAPGKLFSPEYAAGALLTVLDRLTPSDSGQFFAWDGSRIPF
jgi:NAD(P)-dependent dehydrogenase (short-subunit alcohol dehydrogenase family)